MAVTSSSLSVSAVDAVFISEATGDLHVTGAMSSSGNITLTAAKGTAYLVGISAPDGTVSVSALKAIVNGSNASASDITAGNVSLTATRGAIGSVQLPVTVQTTGTLSATAATGVFITASGVLTVNNVASAKGNVQLTVSGPAGTAADLILAANETIKSGTGTIELLAADTIETGAGSTISSGSTAAKVPTVLLDANRSGDAENTEPYDLQGTIKGKKVGQRVDGK